MNLNLILLTISFVVFISNQKSINKIQACENKVNPVDYKTGLKNHQFNICGNKKFTKNGIYYYNNDFNIIRNDNGSLIYNSDNNFNYEIFSVSDTLFLKQELLTLELSKVFSTSTKSKPQTIFTHKFFIDKEDKLLKIKKKSFDFVKVNSETIKKVHENFNSDSSKLKSTPSFKFPFYTHIHNLFICAFNGDNKAISILNNLENHIELKYLNQLFPINFEYKELKTYRVINDFKNTLEVLNKQLKG